MENTRGEATVWSAQGGIWCPFSICYNECVISAIRKKQEYFSFDQNLKEKPTEHVQFLHERDYRSEKRIQSYYKLVTETAGMTLASQKLSLTLSNPKD